MERTKPKRLRFFEQLGAPSLLFRNVDAYLDVSNTCDDYGPSAIEDFWEERERCSRAHARHCYLDNIKMPSSTTNSGHKRLVNQQKVERARRHISLWMKKGSENLTFESNNTNELSQFKKKLALAQKYKSAYLRSHLIACKPATNRGIRRAMLDFSVFLTTRRRDLGDPEYMAPFPKDDDYEKMNGVEAKVGAARRVYPHPFGSDHPHRPSLYGNCLACFHCSCSHCTGNKDPTICLVHPSGGTLDQLRLSFIALPRGQRREDLAESMEEGPPMQLDVGETIRGLRHCGSETYMARTDLFCIFFKVSLDVQDTHGNSLCGSWFKLSLLHKVDLRSLSRFASSYIPSSIACHPKYGSSFSKPRCAIVSACQKTGERVTVHLVQCGDQEVPITKHRFNNLHDISLIEFSMNHPMVLWSAARSFVHPIPKATIASQDLQLGFGSALFCLDARSEQAIFQWSPSREEFAAEGVHGLSGIHVDEKLPHSLWVSSTSAGKVWEIDSRMPSSPVTTWSLAHACDGLGVVLPPTAQYGAGNLFARPLSSTFHAKQREERYKPLLSVSQDPGAFSLNVYQRPSFRPRFETHSLECIADPNLTLLKGISASSSSIFLLPNISDKVFVTGLVSFDVSPTNLLSFADLVRIGYADRNEIDAFCAMTMNNKGDLHIHTILDGGGKSESSKRLNSECHVGERFIPLPKQSNGSHQNEKPASHTLALGLRLHNIFPIPASAFTMPAINHDMRSLATSSIGKLGPTSVLSQEKSAVGESYLDGEMVHENETYPSFVHVDRSKLSSAISLPTPLIAEAKTKIQNVEEDNFLSFCLEEFDKKDTRSRSDMSFNTIDKVSEILGNWKDS